MFALSISLKVYRKGIYTWEYLHELYMKIKDSTHLNYLTRINHDLSYLQNSVCKEKYDNTQFLFKSCTQLRTKKVARPNGDHIAKNMFGNNQTFLGDIICERSLTMSFTFCDFYFERYVSQPACVSITIIVATWSTAHWAGNWIVFKTIPKMYIKYE